jgi:CrcB protein
MRRNTIVKAMGFAIIVPADMTGTNDSWLPRGARSFLFRNTWNTSDSRNALVVALIAKRGHCSALALQGWLAFGAMAGNSGGVSASGIGATLRLTLIAIFGAVGTLARYGMQGLVQVGSGGTFPYGTLLVNLSGCFLLGLIAQFTLNRLVISPDWRVAITVGFFGGYTTFSSFGWEAAKMLEDGEWIPATTYVVASVLAGLLLSVAGIRLANRF